MNLQAPLCFKAIVGAESYGKRAQIQGLFDVFGKVGQPHIPFSCERVVQGESGV